MVRWVVVAGALAAVVAGCGSAPVRTERADLPIGPAPTAEAPPTAPTGSPTTPPLTSPTTPSDTRPEAPPDTRLETSPDARASTPASTSSGDGLFPALGSSDVDVIAYDVGLEVDAEARVLRGSVVVEALVEPGRSTLPLDAVGLDVSRASVDGTEARFSTTDEELIVELPDDRQARIVAEIDYTVAPRPADSPTGLPTGWFGGADGTSFVLNEPDGARTWMPSNDHPSDKATWRFEIVAPPDAEAIANGELLGGGAGDPWVWVQDEPMPTYLVLLVVGDYEIVDGEPVTTADGRRIPITHVVPAGKLETFEPFFGSVSEQIAFFEEHFGPFPLDRYGLAFVDGLGGIAMETFGRSMFGAGDFATGDRYTHQLLLAHELAHQWFGNAVSPADWGDIWLNESPATYAQWMWLDELGLQALDDEAEEHLQRRQRARGSTADAAAEDLFGYLRYDGGAVVVHALRRELGDVAFFAVMAGWVVDRGGSSATTEDFVAHVEETVGRDLDVFFDDWLYADALPAEYPG